MVQETMADFNNTRFYGQISPWPCTFNASLATARTATFTIIPFYDENEDGILNNGECEGTPYVATITVNPVPELSFEVNGVTTADNDFITHRQYLQL
ncbi:MAG: hypothetical protein R3B47_06885 [Bacteroidia bacterium]